jgi:hypothetical protein
MGGDHDEMRREFDRQVANLVSRGYPRIVGIGPRRFHMNLQALKGQAGKLTPSEFDPGKGRLPFVIVIHGEWVEAEKVMSLVEREEKSGFTKMFPREPGDFRPIEGVNIPSGLAYLAVDIERGGQYNDIPPREALKSIKRRRRSPLTIDEGIAIITQYPEFLSKNGCYSMLASRCKGDLRVPAIWITKENRVRLGWCWDGNPHSWLGSASCGYRVGL